MIEQGLYQLLAADLGVQGFVQDPSGQARIYGVMLPKNYKLPAIVFSTVSRHAVESLRGPNLLEQSRFQFDCYASGGSQDGFLVSRKLVLALKKVLFPLDADGNPTSLRTALPDGTKVDGTRMILELDKPFEVGEGGYIFCATVDVMISFVNQSS